MESNMRSSISDVDGYLSVCSSAAENNEYFNNFKRMPEYKKVLEHVTKEQGLKYLDIILKQSPHYLTQFDQFRENDRVGNPEVQHFEGHGTMSPTTLRYIKVASDLDTIFGSLGDYNIVEIGSGYGGQSKILMDIHQLNSYTYIDLPQVLKLNAKYMSKFSYPYKMNFLTDLKTLLKEYDLIISNYAFTECEKIIQKFYIDQIINKCTRGYITCNFVSDAFNIRSFSKEELINNINKNIFIKEESPLTHPNNCIMCWDDNEPG